jgi:hypothetical protein
VTPADGAGARAVIVVVAGENRCVLGHVPAAVPCDLGLIDTLLRLAVTMGRRGWRVELVDVDVDLRALVELIGVAERLGVAPAG